MREFEPLAPSCGHRGPERGGTCFPGPCKRHVEREAYRASPEGHLAAAVWRVQQCRETVAQGEVELDRRRAALRQAEIALREIKGEEAV